MYKRLIFAAVIAASAAIAAAGQVPGRHRQFNFHEKTGVKLATVNAVYFDTRWLPKQIDEKFQLVHEEPENPTPAIKWQSGIGSASDVIAGLSNLPPTATVNAKFPGIGATGWVPPDPNLAAGPSYLIETVNASLAFFDKATGAKVFQQDFQTFFSSLGTGSFLFDPKVMYDKVSGRFFVLADEEDGNSQTSKLDIAVSKTNNPNGGWYMYRIEAKQTINGNTYWLDYPSLATSSTGVAMTGNMFPFSSGGFGGVQFIVLPKAPMLVGGSVTPTSIQDPSLGSAQVARNSEPTQTDIYALTLSSSSTMRVYDIKNPDSNPTLQFTDVAIPSYSGAQNAASSLGGHSLDTLGDRIFNVYQRNGHLVTGHSVLGTSGKTNAKWYQFGINGWPNTTGKLPSLIQTGVITTGAGDDTWLPAVNENANGDISVIFSRSNPNTVADIMIATRVPTDPLGFMSTPQVLGGSSTVYGGGGVNRWGDFFDVAIDPNDDLTFWGIEMTGDTSGNWITEFYNWSTSTGGVGGSGNEYDPHLSVIEGLPSGGNDASATNVDRNTFNVLAQNVARLGTTATVEADFKVTDTLKNSLQFTYSAVAAKGCTTFVLGYNQVTRRYDVLQTTPTAVKQKAVTVNIQNYANYIAADGSVKILLRTVYPQRRAVGLIYRLMIDQAILVGQ